jgi:16S rRNA processing protein RimM
MTDGPFALVAHVMRTHGLKGEVSVAPAAETSFSHLLGVNVWFVPPSSIRQARIQGVRPGPKGPIVALEGVDSVDQAKGLTGARVLALHADLPSLWFDDRPEIEDLTGYVVTDVCHGLLGELVETIITGANDVWVVHGPLGEVLIPVIEQVVNARDDDARTISVTLLDGLLPDDKDCS